MIRIYLILTLTFLHNCFCYYAVREWGDNCTHSDDCYDPRMICEIKIANTTGKCVCDRFHLWDAKSQDCIQMVSVEYMMNQTVFEIDNAVGRREREQENMFRGPIYAVYFMIFVIAFSALSIVIYCWYIRKKDHELRNVVRKLTDKAEEKKQQQARNHESLYTF